MKAQTINLAPLAFRAQSNAGSINADARTVDVVFSTGAAVERYDWATGSRYLEVLSMKPGHVRLGRLNDGASVLDSHSGYSLQNVLGAVVEKSARIADGLGTATLRFSRRASVEEIWQDVRDGVVKFVSIGYRVYKFIETAGKDGGLPTRTAVDWEPFEVSMVPMPADAGAKVRGADAAAIVNPCVIEHEAQEIGTMSQQQTPTDPQTPPAAPTVETRQAPAPVVDAAAVAEQARQQEQTRITGIQNAVRVAGLESSVAADLIRQNVSLDQARARIFEQLEQRSGGVFGVQSVTPVAGGDAREKWLRGASFWLLQRSGMAALVAQHQGEKVSDYNPGEFRGLSLMDLARESLERNGVKTRGMSRMDVAGMAMAHRSTSYQTQSDFAVLLENTLHKVLQAGYGLTPDTWSRVCQVATAMDFRANPWYRLGALSVLDATTEHGEFKSKALPDAEKGSYTVATKGNIVAVTRQTILNDDLGAIARLTQGLGRAGKLTIEVGFYSLLGQNSGLGPTQSDSQPLFHANRANVGTGAAISAASLDADRVVMASQKEPGGQEYTDLRPSILLLPIGLGGQARVINQSQYDPDTVANKSQMKPNIVAGLFRDVVDTPRLTGTRRYLFADPAIAPVFVVSFLEGQREPVLETKDGWNVDGVELKARLDVGIDAVDWRGAVTNAGV